MRRFSLIVVLILPVVLLMAQQIKAPATKKTTQPQSKSVTPPPKQSLPEKFILKLNPNLRCTIKIDGEVKGIVEADDVLKIELNKGSYVIQAISAQNSSDKISFDYTVAEISAQDVYKIDLVKIRDTRMVREKTAAEAAAKAEALKNQNILTDSRDGKTYKTVKIGDQIWMAENLAYKAYTGCMAYANNISNIATFGYLYNWETAKNVCPPGWHLPSDAEWTTLERFICTSIQCYSDFPLDGSKWGYRGTNEGNCLKTSYSWSGPNTGANNSSGFTALPGGNWIDGKFSAIYYFGDFWSSTQIRDKVAWGRGLYYNRSDIDRNVNDKNNGFSVRCMKD